MKLGQESISIEILFTGPEYVHLLDMARNHDTTVDGLLRSLAHMASYHADGVPLGYPYTVKLVPTKPVYFGGKFWKRVRDIASTLTGS